MLGKRLTGALLSAAAAITLAFATPAQADDKPITIGFGMALTGGLGAQRQGGPAGDADLGGEHNAHGGLLGRPVKLVYYDDQSNPSTVPGLYTKLLDVDHVDLVVSGYATNMIAPAMPVIMQHNRTFLSLFGLAANTEFQLSEILFLHADRRPDPEADLYRGLLRRRHGTESDSPRRSRSLARTPSSRITRSTGRWNWSRSTD